MVGAEDLGARHQEESGKVRAKDSAKEKQIVSMIKFMK